MIKTYGNSSKNTVEFTHRLLLDSIDGIAQSIFERISEHGIDHVFNEEDENTRDKILDEKIIPDGFDFTDEKNRLMLKYFVIFRSVFEEALKETLPDIKVDAKNRAISLMRLVNYTTAVSDLPGFKKFVLSAFPKDAKKAARKEFGECDNIRKIKNVLNTYHDGIPFVESVAERTGLPVNEVESVVENDESLNIQTIQDKRFIITNI